MTEVIDVKLLDQRISESLGWPVLSAEQTQDLIDELQEAGLEDFQTTGPYVDRVRDRTYLSGDEALDMLLDLRNVFIPPKKEQDAPETTDDTADEPTEQPTAD